MLQQIDIHVVKQSKLQAWARSEPFLEVFGKLVLII